MKAPMTDTHNTKVIRVAVLVTADTRLRSPAASWTMRSSTTPKSSSSPSKTTDGRAPAIPRRMPRHEQARGGRRLGPGKAVPVRGPLSRNHSAVAYACAGSVVSSSTLAP